MPESTNSDREYRTFPCEANDIYTMLQEELRRRATTGGAELVQELFGRSEVHLCEWLRPLSWVELQGRYLGVFGAFFYFWDENLKQVRLVNLEHAGRPSLNPPTLDVSRIGTQWCRDDKRHHTTLETLQRYREESRHVEFYRLFSDTELRQQRLTPTENLLNVMICPEGEVCFFIFEWLLRTRFRDGFEVVSHDEIRSVPTLDALKWLETELADDGRLTRDLEEYGIIGSTGSSTARSRLVFEWIELQVNAECRRGDRRFLGDDGIPWFSTWASSVDAHRFIGVNQAEGSRVAFMEVSRQLLQEETGRSSSDVERMSRFLIPSHMDYRRRDSGMPKAVFACPLGPTKREEVRKESVAFVVGAIDLVHEPQSQFFDGLLRSNRRRLSFALSTLGIMGYSVESQLREDAARALAAEEARRLYVTESVQTFSIIAHEISSLLWKHFVVLREEVGIRAEAGDVLAKRTQHAWDVVAATAEIGYLFAKAVSMESESQTRRTLRERFLAPLATLWKTGRLEYALYEVACRVCELESKADSGSVDLQVHFPGGAVEPLTADQYARCYMLVAEPLRNLLHHGRRAGGTWCVRLETAGFEIELVHSRAQQHLPQSKTFQTLGKFLEALPGCEAKRFERHDNCGNKKIAWLVRIGGQSWQEAVAALK